MGSELKSLRSISCDFIVNGRSIWRLFVFLMERCLMEFVFVFRSYFKRLFVSIVVELL